MKTRLLLLCLLATAACTGSDTKTADMSAAESATASNATPAPAVAAPAPSAALLTPDSAALYKPGPARYSVVFVTSQGEVEVQVDRALAPRGADRLYYMASNGFFTGAKFFRVVAGFMAQFGLSGIPAVDEAFDKFPLQDDPRRMSNKKGTLAFATAGPNTRTTQMFINLVDNGDMLDNQGFAPVGQVTRGMEAVEKLFSSYAETSNQQGLIMSRGNAWLNSRYPDLDSIVTATVKP